MKEKYDAFLSHSSKDKETTEKVCSFLEGEGVKCWIAPRDIKPGSSYASQIIEAIQNCHIFVLLVSKNSNNSEHVCNEIDRAFNCNKLIVPFMLQDIQLSDEQQYYLARKQHIDAYTSFENGLSDLLPIIRAKKPKNEYAVYYTNELIDMGRQPLEIECEIENLTRKTMAGIDDVEEEWLGNPQQWADVQNEHPRTTRILVYNNKIVGYSFFLFLEAEVIEKIKNGSHSDAENNLENIVYVDFPGEYPLYFDDIAILQEHRFRGAKILVDDFVNQLIDYAKEGIFITELCSVAFTKQGEDFCKHFEMELTGKSNLGDNVYSLKLLPFPKDSYIAKNYPELKKLYDEKFDRL